MKRVWLAVAVLTLVGLGQGACLQILGGDHEPDLKADAGGAGGSGGNGTTATISTSTPCQTFICTGGACQSTKVLKGHACMGSTGVCTSAGACVTCFEDSGMVYGCPAGQDCVDGLCAGCTNGTLDPNETDIDCGGTCTPCANGKACKVGADCASGTCSDGVCCSSDCSGACASCAMASHVGTCTDVPKGINGQPACPNSGDLCDGAGMCAAAGGLSPIGANCTMSSTCFNQNCAQRSCKLKVGEPCNDPIECDTGRCASNVCATCAMDADCLSGKCDTATSRCKLPSGYYCQVNSDCLIDTCFSGYCVKASGACTVNADCTSKVCKNGTCSPCMSDAECQSNKCTNGTCLAPTGAYCNGGADCGSGSCVPAPVFKKCQ